MYTPLLSVIALLPLAFALSTSDEDRTTLQNGGIPLYWPEVSQRFLDEVCGGSNSHGYYHQVGFTSPVFDDLPGAKVCLISEYNCAVLDSEMNGFWLASGFEVTLFKYVCPWFFPVQV